MTARPPLQPNLEFARLFLDVLAPREQITFQTFAEGATTQHSDLTRILHGTLDEHADTLTHLNQQGAGVFVMVNGGNLKGRKAENVQRVRAVFVDLDGAPLDPVLTFSLKPHIVCDSSPGKHHAYWMVNDCTLEDFTPIQQAIAAHFAGDPSVKDLPRVMRVPGFYHHKSKPTLSTIRSTEERAPYSIVQIKAALTAGRAAGPQSSNADALGGIRTGVDPDEPCPEGQRNNRLASLAGRWIAEGKSFDDLVNTARDWNQRCCVPPLDDAEVRAVCTSIWRKHARENTPSGAMPPLADVAADCDTPIPFTESSPPEIPASLLPEPFAQFAGAVALATETPEGMATFAVLGSLSAAVAGKFAVSPWQGWQEPINIYTVVALPPANNKSLVLSRCTQPLREWEISKAMALEPELQKQRSERKNQEKLIDSLRAKAVQEKNPTERIRLFGEVTDLEGKLPKLKVLPQLFVNDATPESLATSTHEQGGRFAVISDEGGIFETLSGLYSNGMANIDLILKGIDGGDVRVRRKDRSVDLRPFLTFVLVVQPRIIQSMGERRAFQGNGLLERFLYVVPASKLGYRTLDTPPVAHHIQAQYNQAVHELLELQPIVDANGREQARTLTLAPDAVCLFREYRGDIETLLRPEGALHACLGWGGKLVGATLRLAGLLHVAEHGDRLKVISCDTMQRAAYLGYLLIDHARAAYNLMGMDQAQDDAKAILAWIKARGHVVFSRTDCLRALHGRFTRSERLTAAFKALAERNIVRGPESVITTPGKRPTMMFRVNPMVLCTP